ncbi:MAG: thiosulfate oxidation carrier complex protein SoxZ [Acetobacteraceae bacterium]
MATPKPRVRLPATAKKGEIIEIKTLIAHDMESGQRKDSSGKIVPRKIINKFAATINGKPLFSADWHPSISANPYQSFFARIEETSTIEFKWTDDDGTVYETSAKVTVA